MCRAFSCIVEQSGKVHWKLGIDPHSALLANTSLKDNTADPQKMTFARVEITPDNRDYLFPDNWTLKVDQSITPNWFSEKHRTAARSAHKKWMKKLDKILIRKKIVHPFKLTPPSKITDKHINMLREWDSVWDSVWGSVWGSVRDSVGDSVGDSVWGSVWGSVGDSVWDSVRDSVGDSVWGSVGGSVGAYVGSFFNLPKWKYVNHVRGRYPFKPCVQLWNLGIVPSFDGAIWRLHGGPKDAVLFSIAVKDLRK